tara:strand:- start:7944 stop:10658 length:2715 start_codon:yes stop_codon:yes gene_type:complete
MSITVKTLVPLAACLVLGCTKSTPESHLANAEKAFDEGQVQVAVIELKSALELNTTDNQIRFKLAQALFESGDLAGAEKELLRLIDTEIDQYAVQGILGFALYYQAKFEDVILLADDLGDKAQTPLKIAELISTLKAGLPSDLLSRMLQREAQKDELSLVEILMQIKQYQVSKPLAALESLSLPSFYDVFLSQTKAQLIAKTGDVDKAASIVQKLTNKWPSVGLLALNNVEFLIAKDELVKAENLLHLWLKNNRRSPLFDLLMAEVQVRKGNFEEGLLSAENALHSGLKSFDAYLLAGLAASELGKWEAAYSHLTKAYSARPDDRTASRLLARAQLELGYHEEAFKLLQAIDVKDISDINFVLGASAFLDGSGQQEKALQLISSSLQKTPNANALLVQQFALQQGNNNLEADITLKRLEASNADPTAIAFFKVQSAIGKEDYDGAMAIAHAFKSTDATQSYLLTATVELAKGNHDSASRLAEQVLQEDARNAAAMQIAMQAEYQLANFSKAIEHAKQLVELSQTSSAVDNLVYLLDESPEHGVIATLERLSTVQASPVLYHLGLVKAHAIRLEYGKAVQIGERKPEVVRLLPTLVWVNLLIGANKEDEAEKAIRDWIYNEPDSLEARLVAINFYQTRQEIEKAKEVVLSSEKLFPDESRFSVAHFELLLSSGNTEQAKAKLNTLRQADLPLWHLAYYKGQLAFIERDYALAEKEMLTAYQEVKRFGIAVIVARIKAARNSALDGVEILKDALASIPVRNERPYHITAEYALASGYHTIAIDIYNDLLSRWPDSAVAYNNKANVLMKAKEWGLALEAAKQAIALERTSSYLDTYGWVLFNLKQFENSLTALEEAHSLDSSSEEIALHLAMSYQKSGQKSEAKALKLRFFKDSSRFRHSWETIKVN